MTAFTWLHLSDLHLRGSESSVELGHFDDMLGDIAAQIAKEHLSIDAVFFTGDVAFSGQAEQYNKAIRWLDRILDLCGLSGRRDRLCIVPGNHDVNRQEVNRAGYTRRFHEDLAKRLLEGETYDEINRWLGATPKVEDKEDRVLAFAKFRNFIEFATALYSDSEPQFDHDKCYCVRSIEKEGYVIAVLGFNSAWLSFGDNEQGRLLLGEIQVSDALEEARRKWPSACLRIGLMHHPLYWLAENDIHRIQQHLPGRCDIVLRGHLHYPSFSIQSTPDAHLLEFAAGASLKANYHAYNIVTLDLASRQGIAMVRLQHPDIGGKWGADNFTYRNSENGKITFSL